MTSEHELAERLRKLEALFARPGTEGERAAAGNALEHHDVTEAAERPETEAGGTGSPRAREASA